MIAMNIWEDIPPTYAAALLFEKYEDQSIKIFFRNGTSENDIYNFTPNICGKDVCTLTDLNRALADVISQNWDQECGNTTRSDPCSGYPLLVVLLIISWTLFTVTLYFTKFSCRLLDQIRPIFTRRSNWANMNNTS